MAGSISLKPPASFNFRKPDEWPHWLKRFEQFRLASGLSEEKSEARQISTLLYCLGEEAESVLASTHITTEERQKYDTVVAKLNSYFKVRKNVIFERARFNRRNQLPGESAEEYITTLYSLVENCEYGDLTSQMIRDRLVVGIRDTVLSERLQMDANLTLDKAMQMVRQREAIQQQQIFLKETDKAQSSVDYVQGRKFKSLPTKSATQHKDKQTQKNKCIRCGNKPHPRSTCPARDSVCHKCKKKGHYSSQCLLKHVNEMTSDSQQPTEDLDVIYLEAIESGKCSTWNVTININGQPVMFKLDTGAEVTAVTQETVTKLGNVVLKPATKSLCGPDRKPLQVLGKLTATLSSTHHKCEQEIYVLQQLKHNLLDLPAIQQLHLLAQVNQINQNGIAQKFPNLFTGLGTFTTPFEITLKPDAKPFSLHTPRKVPLPLRQKVKDEPDRMQSIGVISKVDTPTQWCAGMVVVPKKDKSVRICVDLKPLNSSVLREIYPLPKVDDTLAQLSGAKLFTKLDANSGFWQIPLAEKSRHLTTFVTPFGRFCFNKMPFGISSAPEHFQKRMNEIIDGLPGVLCLMDDVLVCGSDQQEHDTRLDAVLTRIHNASITLNKDKCEFAKNSITFLGHVINSEGVSPDPKKTSAISSMKQPTNVSELRRFLGMVNQLGKFSPNIAELSQPLRELLSTKTVWVWGPSQTESFNKLKQELTSSPLLAWYDPTAETKITADASAYGLGAVLMQKSDQQWKPVAYASRSMTKTETRYAQIEKEALATTWACERFFDYILGMRIHIETDHKPLFLYLVQSV